MRKKLDEEINKRTKEQNNHHQVIEQTSYYIILISIDFLFNFINYNRNAEFID